MHMHVVVFSTFKANIALINRAILPLRLNRIIISMRLAEMYVLSRLDEKITTLLDPSKLNLS